MVEELQRERECYKLNNSTYLQEASANTVPRGEGRNPKHSYWAASPVLCLPVLQAQCSTDYYSSLNKRNS